MSFENPWQITSTRLVYENPWIRIREHEVIRPDGAPGIYGVMDTRIATGCVPLTEDLQVYLVGQYRFATDVYSWEIPEGGCDPGEEPAQTIQRELREETGLTAATWTPLGGEFHLSNCISSEVGYVWLAEDLAEGEAAPEETEILKLKMLPLEDALRQAMAGEITDAVTLIALFRAERLLRERGDLPATPPR